MTTTVRRMNWSPIESNFLALLLYESGKYEEAIQCLQEIATSNDIGYKATALNVLGCICAKLVLNHRFIQIVEKVDSVNVVSGKIFKKLVS